MAISVLIAPDKFKGSLSAAQVGWAIREGLLRADPTIECKIVPLADGGEGTAEVLTGFAGGTFQQVNARDPLGRHIRASYGLTPDGSTAFIEMAAASGLHLLPSDARNPLYTGTAGTGDLICDALNRGIRRICIGIGGSATNDGGMGAMIALGMQYYSASGVLLEGCGNSLGMIARIDDSKMHPAFRDASFTIFCDVDNPLHGPRGAAHIFGPQKGATPEMVETLDRGMQHYERVLQRYGFKKTNFPGAGAGGGFPLSLFVFGHATIQPGIEFIMNFVELEHHIQQADIVITGEGRLDEQTLSGKVVKGVASIVSRFHKRLVVLAGSTALSEEDARQLGLTCIVTLVNDDTPLELAISQASKLIEDRVYENYLKITGR